MRSQTLVTLLALTTSTVAVAQPSEPAPSTPAQTPAPTQEDLARAADATAAAATVTAPDPAPAAQKPAPAADDIDLASLGLDPGGSSFDDKLNIYGFADLSYNVLHVEQNSPFVPDTHSFVSGNFNDAGDPEAV